MVPKTKDLAMSNTKSAAVNAAKRRSSAASVNVPWKVTGAQREEGVDIALAISKGGGTSLQLLRSCKHTWKGAEEGLCLSEMRDTKKDIGFNKSRLSWHAKIFAKSSGKILPLKMIWTCWTRS